MTLQRKLLLETLRGHLSLLEERRPDAAHAMAAESLRRHLHAASRSRTTRARGHYSRAMAA